MADIEDRLDIEMQASGYAEGKKKDALEQLDLHLHSEHDAEISIMKAVDEEEDAATGLSNSLDESSDHEGIAEDDKTSEIRKLVHQQQKSYYPRRKTRNAAKLSIKGRLCHRMKINSYDD